MDTIKDIQRVSLEILRVFQELCQKHSLRYFAIGGTCIGAVRHHGFIPWDDDIDVAMPYEDYVRLQAIAKTELKEPYSIIGPNTCKHYHLSYIKIQDENTTFIERSAIKYKDRYSGIFIDIFPVFGLPTETNVRMKMFKKYELLRKINLRIRFPLSEEPTIKGKAFWLLTRPISWVKPYSYCTDTQEKMLGKYPFDESDEVLFAWRAIPKSKSGYQRVFPRTLFTETINLPFEDGEISVPMGYDEYLKMDFGNYMELPPVDQQVSTHYLEVIDVKRSYRDYMRKAEL